MSKRNTPQRRHNILALLSEQGEVSVDALAKRFETSEVTIRKDLTALEDNGLLLRRYGGAVQLPHELELPRSPLPDFHGSVSCQQNLKWPLPPLTTAALTCFEISENTLSSSTQYFNMSCSQRVWFPAHVRWTTKQNLKWSELCASPLSHSMGKAFGQGSPFFVTNIYQFILNGPSWDNFL